MIKIVSLSTMTSTPYRLLDIRMIMKICRYERPSISDAKPADTRNLPSCFPKNGVSRSASDAQ